MMSRDFGIVRTSRAAALAVIAACCLPSVAVAQITYFPNDATINYSLGNLVYVGKDRFNRNTSPTVNVVSGADLMASVFVYNGSQVNMSGGRARQGLIALDTSTVSVTGGEVGGLLTGDQGTTQHKGGTILMSGGTAGNTKIDLGGTLSLHGGSINGAVTVDHGSTLFVDKAGSVSGGIAVRFDSRAFINGGIVFNGVHASSNARVSITGGTVHDGVHAEVVSTVDISGGETTFVSAWGSGTVNLSGSNPDSLSAHDISVVNMNGGSAGRFSTHNNSKGNLYDGVVSGDVTAFDQSTINVYGGTIQGNVQAYGTVNIYGGNKATPNSVNIASFGGLVQYGGNEAKPDLISIASSGGLPDLFAVDAGRVQVFGSGLTERLLDPNFLYEGDGISGFFSKYALSGILQDGTDISGISLLVQNGTGADFALIQVPEPGSVLLIGLGAMPLLAARRRGPAGQNTERQ